MRVLVVKLSAFGDLIHSLPALDDLLRWPGIREVHWLVDERYRFVTEVFPRGVHVHSVALKGRHPVRSAWHTIRDLRRLRFDALLDLQGLIKSAVLARACGSPVYGIDRSHLREKASGLLVRPVPFHPDERHVVQQYRRVATAVVGERAYGDSPLPYQAPHIDLAQTACVEDPDLATRLGLTEKGYVVLHAAGGWETKQLPDATWLAVARTLPGATVPVFTWGNEKERALARSLAAACDGLALPERLGMSALCALLMRAHAVVGADTGLLHLAAALGTPTVSFWGPSASWRSAPLGERDWQIESNPDCGPCFQRTCDHFICMDAIRPEAIAQALHALWTAGQPSSDPMPARDQRAFRQ